jgi:hypothetical protein
MSTSGTDDWLSPTRRQQRQAVTITPNVSSIQSYRTPSIFFSTLLTSDSETEAEVVEQEIVFVPEENPEVVTEGGPSDDKDEDFTTTESTATSIDTFDIKTEEEMSAPMVAIATLLDPQDLTPFIGAYNISDVRLFCTRLGNVLFNCVHEDHDTGHAYLVDTLEQYQHRVRNRTLVTYITHCLKAAALLLNVLERQEVSSLLADYSILFCYLHWYVAKFVLYYLFLHFSYFFVSAS